MTAIHAKKVSRTPPASVIMFLGFMLQIVQCKIQGNLLINGDLSMTNLSGMAYFDFPGSIPGWNCTSKCEVDDCLLLNQYYQSYGLYNANCTGMVIDLMSDNPENLTQNVTLTQGVYLFSLNYYYPRAYAHLKTMQIFFNQVLIFNFTPNVSFLYIPQYFEQQVQGIPGVNSLRLTTIRNSGSDGYGFFVNNLSLIQLYNSFQELVSSTILNKIGFILIQIPGSRVLFGDIMTCFINFDRLQFYYFHNRNFSEYSTILLAKINVLNSLKGILLKNIFHLFDQNFTGRIDEYFSSIDYKYGYSSNITLTRNPENGGGFVSNCYEFFAYTVPGTVMIYLLLLGLFRAVRNRPSSRLIRQYSFLGLLLFMFFEGNIESFTYYAFGELRLLFSARFQHKLINIFITFFQWAVTVLAVGGVLWFQHHYGKRVRYFLENKRANSLGVLCQIVEKGVICLVFGAIHQIMQEQPKLQLFALFVLQGTWMSFKVFSISRKVYERNIPQFIMFSSGLTRMCFILTFYFYQQQPLMRNLINNSVHMALVAIILLLWLKEFTISLLQLAYFYYKFCKKLRRFKQKVPKNKIGCQFTKITEGIGLVPKDKISLAIRKRSVRVLPVPKIVY